MADTALRIACVQLEPVFKNPAKSIKRADELLQPLERGSVDFLVLPEMAFTGYCFTSREDIAPWIEEVPAGRTSKWAMKTARRLGCYVQVGVPTLAPLSRPEQELASHDAPTVDDLYYNSVLLVNPQGKIETVYHKHFLFETDQTWATPGDAFVTRDLAFPAGGQGGGDGRATFRWAPAICMDLNAEAFDASLERLEFSNFVRRERVDLVVASNAWLDAEAGSPATVATTAATADPATDDGEEAAHVREGLDQEKEADGRGGAASWDEVRGLIGYWVYRMSTNLEDPAVGFVVCNRIGCEGDVVFAGSSCVIELGDRPTVVKHSSKNKEELLVSQIRLPLRD
ncbi:hypothetical protein JCM11491_001664 [Sporobolomyces phaffii]